jgi:integrase/recombinase XerC
MKHLRLVDAGSLMRLLEQQLERAVKDKSYQQTPLGAEGRDFLLELRDQNKSPKTEETYERPIAWLALEFPHMPGMAGFCNPDGLRLLKDFRRRRWGDAAIDTQRTYTAALRSFGNWGEEEGVTPYNPFRKLKLPRSSGTQRVAHPRDEIDRLLARQESLREECALGLFVGLALRKEDVRLLQIRDIDLPRDVVYLRHRKGGGFLTLPIEYAWLKQNLYLHIQGEQRNPREYLIFPKNERSRPMDPSSFHRWFKRCLERAGLDSFPLHELRHTADDDIFRRTGNLVAAQQLLGHKSIETTRRYLHPSDADLRAWMQIGAWTPEEV